MESASLTEESVSTALVDLWRSLLKDQGLNETSSFLDEGGSSVTAVQIRTWIRRTLSRDVGLIDVMDKPTPEGLAPIVVVAPDWAE